MRELLMKKVLLLLALMAIVFTFLTIISFNDQPYAGGGCCMERDNPRSSHWYENGVSFRKCQDLNRRRDNDDLYERAGYIYWEENC